jgi:hypothetical protein
MTATAPKPPPKPEYPEVYPDVEPGDCVYVRHPKKGPMSVRVMATGKHGLTASCPAGDLYRVHWARVLGVKDRVARKVRVVDNGQEGCIVEDDKGQRRYIAHEDEAGDDSSGGSGKGKAETPTPAKKPKKAAGKPMAKAFPAAVRALLFLRAEQH